MSMLRLGCCSAAVSWVWKRPDLREKIQLEESGVKFNDLPVSRRQWLDVDAMCNRRIEMDQNADLLSFGEPK